MNQRNKALLIGAFALLLAIAATGMANYGARRLYMPEPYQSLTMISILAVFVLWPMVAASFLLATILKPSQELAYTAGRHVTPVRILLSMGPNFDAPEKWGLTFLVGFGIGSMLKVAFIALLGLIAYLCVTEPLGGSSLVSEGGVAVVLPLLFVTSLLYLVGRLPRR